MVKIYQDILVIKTNDNIPKWKRQKTGLSELINKQNPHICY